MFENLEKEIIDLGFNNKEEMYLYHDVCGFDIIPTFDREELLERCNDNLRGRTKEEFIDYIEKNNLINLFNRIKDLPVLDRFIELYDSYYNEFVLTNFMLGKYNSKWKEAMELYDGEKEAEYQQIRKGLFLRINELITLKSNLEISAIYRLDGEEQEKFFEHAEEIEKHNAEIEEKKRKGRK